MSNRRAVGSHERWAHLRFSVVGPLLASPPAPGELYTELARLAEKVWRHPVTGEPVQFGLSTIERWYYAARSAQDPVGVLRRKVRKDRGRQQAVSAALGQQVHRQYREHPSWTVKLHHDNLEVVVAEKPQLGPLPSYSSLRRYMAAQRLVKQRRLSARSRFEAQSRTREPFQPREVRSYEAEYVGGLWHLDFHQGSLKILTTAGDWLRPILLGILDDRSRLGCHAQWYLAETAETHTHGLGQAFLKRGLPRGLLSDRGSAMIAAETREGLERLSILHPTTLPYSRLLAMLEGQPDLTLALLNQATQAWLELEYNRTVHSETGQTPLERWLDGPTVMRPCPELEALRLAFTTRQWRTQRRSDGTISLEGTRFEIPARFRHLPRLPIRYARWDLGHVWLVDERTGAVLDRLYPLDRAHNAEGVRRPVEPPPAASSPSQPPGIAPLLRKLMAEYAATGLPPAYIPKEMP